jgi:putative flippase GtrA
MGNLKGAFLGAGGVVRFGIAGLGLNGLAFGCYLLLADVLGLEPRVSISIVQAVFLPVSLWVQKTFTFGSFNESRHAILMYVLGYLASIAFQVASLYLFHSVMHYPHQIVAGIGLLMGAGGFYLVQRRFVFAASSIGDKGS